MIFGPPWVPLGPLGFPWGPGDPSSGLDPEAAIASYEQFKRDYKPPGDSETTETQCRNQNFNFVPIVVEANCGGWGKEALRVSASIEKSIEAA